MARVRALVVLAVLAFATTPPPAEAVVDAFQPGAVHVVVQPVPTALAPGTHVTLRLLDADDAAPVTFACTDYGLAVFPLTAFGGFDAARPHPLHNLGAAVWQTHVTNAWLPDGSSVTVFPGAATALRGEPGVLWAYQHACGDAEAGADGAYSIARNLLAARRAPGFASLSAAATPVFVQPPS